MSKTESFTLKARVFLEFKFQCGDEEVFVAFMMLFREMPLAVSADGESFTCVILTLNFENHCIFKKI